MIGFLTSTFIISAVYEVVGFFFPPHINLFWVKQKIFLSFVQHSGRKILVRNLIFFSLPHQFVVSLSLLWY